MNMPDAASALKNEPYTVILLNAEQNAFFGEIGLLPSDRRSSTVTAETNRVLLFTIRSTIIAFVESEP
jgi:CRP-like cAMP-binding protein